MAATIGDLPEEMLTEILAYLDGKSVKEAALVCKEWNRIIGTTPKIMKKFTLKVEGFNLYPQCFKIFGDIMSLERHFTTLSITVQKETDESRLVKLIERHGGSILNLDLDYYKSTSENMLQILRSVPKLESLEFHIWSETDLPSSGNFQNTVTLGKLKKVNVTEKANFLQLIHAPMLKDLALIYRPDSKSIEKLLKTSPNLESLEVSLDVFEEMEPGFPFHLKKFKEDALWGPITENIKKFLLSQAGTVEVLKASHANPEFLELVLTKFKRLRTLYTNFVTLAGSLKFYEQLKPMPKLTELKYLCNCSSEGALRAVLGNCPNLERLDGHDCNILPNHLDFVAEHNKSLRSLRIGNMTATNARFQCLKHLCLHRIENGGVLVAFLKLNATIETLEIENLARGVLTDDNIDFLVTGTNLKHLELRGIISQEVFDTFDKFDICTLKLYRDYQLEVSIQRKVRRVNCSSLKAPSKHYCMLKNQTF